MAKINKGAVSSTVLNGFKWENFHQLGEALFKSDTLFIFTARHENASKLGWRSMYYFLAFETARYGHGITMSPLARLSDRYNLLKRKFTSSWKFYYYCGESGKSRKIFHGFHLSRNMRVKELRNVYYLL